MSRKIRIFARYFMGRGRMASLRLLFLQNNKLINSLNKTQKHVENH